MGPTRSIHAGCLSRDVRLAVSRVVMSIVSIGCDWALNDVVGSNPVTCVELRIKYNDGLEANSEMKSFGQAA